MEVFGILDQLVLCVIGLVAAGVSGYAFLHVLRQRPDAFTAVGRMTKNAWLGIVGASGLFLLVIPLFRLLAEPTFGGLLLAFRGPLDGFSLFWLAGLVATLVYLVDVRPAVVGVQRGDWRG